MNPSTSHVSFNSQPEVECYTREASVASESEEEDGRFISRSEDDVCDFDDIETHQMHVEGEDNSRYPEQQDRIELPPDMENAFKVTETENVRQLSKTKKMSLRNKEISDCEIDDIDLNYVKSDVKKKSQKLLKIKETKTLENTKKYQQNVDSLLTSTNCKENLLDEMVDMERPIGRTSRRRKGADIVDDSKGISKYNIKTPKDKLTLKCNVLSPKKHKLQKKRKIRNVAEDDDIIPDTDSTLSMSMDDLEKQDMQLCNQASLSVMETVLRMRQLVAVPQSTDSILSNMSSPTLFSPAYSVDSQVSKTTLNVFLCSGFLTK